MKFTLLQSTYFHFETLNFLPESPTFKFVNLLKLGMLNTLCPSGLVPLALVFNFNSSTLLLFLKVQQFRFENLAIYSCSFKKNTQKISHPVKFVLLLKNRVLFNRILFFLSICKQTFCKLYGFITWEFLELRMRNFPGIIFIWKQTYREIFKSALVYLYVFWHNFLNSRGYES